MLLNGFRRLSTDCSVKASKFRLCLSEYFVCNFCYLGVCQVTLLN